MHDNIEITEKFEIRNSLLTETTLIPDKCNELIIRDLNSKSILYISGVANKLEVYGYLSLSELQVYSMDIEELALWTLTNDKSKIVFERLKVNEIIKIIHSNLGKASFINCDFCETETEILDVNLMNINQIMTSWNDNIKVADPAFVMHDREFIFEQQIEFFRQLKINSIQRQNQFKTLEYYTKEMNVYFNSMRNLNIIPYLEDKYFIKIDNVIIKFSKKCLITFLEPIVDIVDIIGIPLFTLRIKKALEGFRVWIFKYTNNFGIYWGRPLIIYLVVSYFLFVIATDYEFTKNFSFEALLDPSFPYFINPIKKLSFSDMFHLNSFKYSIIELIAFISQGFLIYQIIRGFRKYTFKS